MGSKRLTPTSGKNGLKMFVVVVHIFCWSTFVRSTLTKSTVYESTFSKFKVTKNRATHHCRFNSHHVNVAIHSKTFTLFSVQQSRL